MSTNLNKTYNLTRLDKDTFGFRNVMRMLLGRYIHLHKKDIPFDFFCIKARLEERTGFTNRVLRGIYKTYKKLKNHEWVFFFEAPWTVLEKNAEMIAKTFPQKNFPEFLRERGYNSPINFFDYLPFSSSQPTLKQIVKHF